MKKTFFLICIMLMCLKSNSQNPKICLDTIVKYYDLNLKELSQWKKDVNGCKKFRFSYTGLLLKNKLIMGMPKKLFFDLFGKADVTGEDDIYIYFANCNCDKKQKHINGSEITQIIFRFNYNLF